MSSQTNDTERAQSLLRDSYHDLAPSAGCEVDLERTLAVAPQEAGPSPIAWARRLAIPFAAALLVAGAWWWGTHHGEGRERAEAPAGPDAPAAPSVVTVRIAANGDVGYSLATGPERFEIRSPLSLLSFGSAEGAPVTIEALSKAFEAIADGLPRDASGTSTVRIAVAPDATVRWSWINWTLQSAAAAKIADVVFVSPTDRTVSIAQPLPADAGVATPAKSVVWRVVLRVSKGTDCEKITTGGCVVDVSAGGRKGALVIEGSNQVLDERPSSTPGGIPEEVPTAEMEANRKRTKEALAALTDDARKALVEAGTSGTTVVGEIDAPPPAGACVPYSAIFDVLSALKAGGVDSVRFVGQAAPKRAPSIAPPPAVPAPTAAPKAPGPPIDANAVLDTKLVRGVHFEDATLAQVATYLTTVTGLKFIVSPKATALGAKVRIDTASMTARTLLDLVTQPYGLRWQVEDFGVVKILEKSE